jgi:hypothetical protein
MNSEKRAVHDYWDAASCGEALYLPTTDRAGYEAQAQVRYALEPFIIDFAHFDEAKGKCLLEIGVGLGGSPAFCCRRCVCLGHRSFPARH